MNAPEFAKLSAELLGHLRKWVTEASRDEGLSVADLALLTQSIRIIEEVTYKEVDAKPDRAN
jgi:hypothetical protein